MIRFDRLFWTRFSTLAWPYWASNQKLVAFVLLTLILLLNGSIQAADVVFQLGVQVLGRRPPAGYMIAWLDRGPIFARNPPARLHPEACRPTLFGTQPENSRS